MEKFEDLRTLSDDDIIGKINQMSPNASGGVDFWYRELDRRYNARTSRSVMVLSVVNVMLAAATTALAVVTLFD